MPSLVFNRGKMWMDFRDAQDQRGEERDHSDGVVACRDGTDLKDLATPSAGELGPERAAASSFPPTDTSSPETCWFNFLESWR